MRLLTALVVVAGMGLRAGAEDVRLEAKSEEDRKTVAAMKSLKVSLNFDETPIAEVVEFLREITQLNVMVSRQASEVTEDKTITLRVDELRLADALGLIVDMGELSYKIDDGVIMIITKDEGKSDVYLELYDVRDLLFHLRDFKAPEISLAETTGGSEDGPLGITTSESGDDSGSLEDPNILVELIKNHTAGSSWNDNPKCSVEIQNGILIVTQSKEGHKQVSRLVEKLRQYK